jgi:ribosomal protein S12 methylthiotransferase accessory factor
LERFGGRRPGAKRTVVRGSYRELGRPAVDPRTLGLFDTDGHRCSQRPYDEDLVFPWVYGFSFGRGEPVLVPEQCAYFDSRLSPGERFVHDTSNGCALGGTLEEAILHGLLEIAERDAFLMTWYARMRVPRVDLDSLADTNCRFVLSHLRDRCGMRVHAFATILEQGIPCYWVMAVDTTGDLDKPQLLCGAGSGLTHETALVNAIRELAVMHSVVANNYADVDKRRQAAAMVADSRLVRQMSDHTLLYSDRGARERLDFLTETPGAGRSVADFSRRHPWPASLDLRDDVTELVGRYVGSGLDVVVVDQTTAEHQAGGFHAVKVIVPGTLPMTFGHGNRRVAGLPRVLEVPAALGYRDRRLELDDLNPYPHPFP